MLRNLLARLRSEDLAHVKEFRRDQAEDKVTEPSDDLDIARSAEELELHASLLARAEDRLKAIEIAFERLDEGTYGICESCGDRIATERLKALPFALYCSDCQRDRYATREVGTLKDEFLQRWTVPEGMAESLGKDDLLRAGRESRRALRRPVPLARPGSGTGKPSGPRKKPPGKRG